jgi:phage-related protein
MGWTVETLNAAVDVEIAALAPDLRARLVRVAELIEEHGLDAVPPKLTKYLGDRLWEIRLTGRDGIARVLYVLAAGPRVVLLRAFVKKTEKTPPSELALARQRAKQVKP